MTQVVAASRILAGVLTGLVAAEACSAFEDRTPRVHALTGARVVTQPGEALEPATIVVRDGIIVAVGTASNVKPPADARIWDLEGRSVYPGLIESYLEIATQTDSKPAAAATPSAGPEAGNRHPNPRVRAETRVVESLALDADVVESLRSIGFTTAHVVPSNGIFRGSSALVALHDTGTGEPLVRADVAQLVAFEHGRWTDTEFRKLPVFPSSLMGAVALVRQTFLDAAWAADATARYASLGAGVERPRTNLAWQALKPTLRDHGHQPVWLLTGDVLGSLRAVRLAAELDLQAVLVGNGEEYLQVETLGRAALPVVLPVDFPKAADVEDPDMALGVELETLRHWEAAPANAGKLHAAGVPTALTTRQLDDRSLFRKRVATAIDNGLSEDAALAALTTVPAGILGVGDRYGTIAKGKVANFTVTDGSLFGEKTQVLEVWVDGERYAVRDDKRDDVTRVAGGWRLVAGDDENPTREWHLEVLGNQWTLRAVLEDDAGAVPVEDLRWSHGELVVRTGAGEALRLRVVGKAKLAGTWQAADGSEASVAGARPEPAKGGTQ